MMCVGQDDVPRVFLLSLVCFSFIFQPILSYENIFRFAFQEVPAQQATEDVSALDHFLEMGGEGAPGCGSGHKW